MEQGSLKLFKNEASSHQFNKHMFCALNIFKIFLKGIFRACIFLLQKKTACITFNTFFKKKILSKYNVNSDDVNFQMVSSYGKYAAFIKAGRFLTTSFLAD